MKRFKSLVELMRKNRAVDLASAEYMILEGFNVNQRDELYWTPLHYAVINGRNRAARCLISSGADVNARNADLFETPLHIAAEKGFHAIAQSLVAGGADIHAVDREYNTPLALALENGHRKTAALLRRHGAEY